MTLFFIGAQKWAGLSKLIEEAGEVVQVCGKLIANSGRAEHWDGTNLKTRLESELGDLLAAIDFVQMHARLSAAAIQTRRDEKFELFQKWHRDHKDASP